MKKLVIDKNSIFFKMTSFVIVFIIIQAVFLIGTLIIGGVLSQAQENSFQSFHDKVQNRNDYIQREMKNRWTNISPYIEEISNNLAESKNDEEFFKKSIDNLIDMLRVSETTGAFIILENESLNKPALYIRDYDPLLNDYSNKDLYMIIGSPDIAKEQLIPLDQSWKYKIKFDESNKEFFEKPFSKAPLTFNANLLGYWSKPFLLFSDDLPIVTYTMPLFDSNQVLRGVIGVEISVNYFQRFLPATDLQPRDSMGYLIGYKSDMSEEIFPIIKVGPLQKRMIKENDTLNLLNVDVDRNIYIIENSNSKEKIYSCVEPIGMYKFNTPFEEESWYLVGMMTENSLLNYVNKIQRILSIAFILSIIIGVIGGYIISYQLTKPITNLVKQVKESDKDKVINFSPTGLTEIDSLSTAMEIANNSLLESTVKMSKIIDLADFPIGAFEIRNDSNHVFVTDQLHEILEISSEKMPEILNSRENFLDNIKVNLISPVEDEDSVYQVESKKLKYVKLKIVENGGGTIGVVIDVSEEIKEKNRIKMERDYDPLTMIFNRKAVQIRIENIIENVRPRDFAALIMFDLDNLKQINDTYGHRWGDLYIKEAVDKLSKVSSNSSVLGRRSGDEFILFLFGFEKREDIRILVNGFYENMSKNLIKFPDEALKPITISGGLLWISDWTLNYDELLHQADNLLYNAKNEKKGFYIESKN